CERLLDDGEVDLHARLVRGDVRRDRRPEKVRTHQAAVEAGGACREQRFDILVAAALAARGDRLHPRRPETVGGEAAKERGAEERLADAGIGPGDEECAPHSSSSSSAAVRSTRSSISSDEMT